MILVTGATGTVGSEVVKRLSAHGIKARAVTRDLRKAEANSLPHIEFVQGDFDDAESIRPACSVAPGRLRTLQSIYATPTLVKN